MTNARTATVFFQDIGCVGHALHATGDHIVDRARRNRLGSHDDRLHAAAAHFVDGGRLHRCRQTGLDRRLAGRGLAEASGQNAAHIDAFNGIALYARTVDRSLYGRRAQIGRSDIG